MEARTTEENLDEISGLSPAELGASIVESAAPVCEGCVPAMRDRAHQLIGFAGIGRLAIGKAVELLSAYNQEICTHLGEIAVAKLPELELANA